MLIATPCKNSHRICAELRVKNSCVRLSASTPPHRHRNSGTTHFEESKGGQTNYTQHMFVKSARSGASRRSRRVRSPWL